MGYHISCLEFGSPLLQRIAVVSCSAVLKFESDRNLLTTRNNYHMLAFGGELLSGPGFRAEKTLSAHGSGELMTIRNLSNSSCALERVRP